MQLAERHGLILLGCTVLFHAWYAAPEIRINRVPLNDLVFHITASERMATAFEKREPFLDAWVSEWDLGYPIWRTYQPLPHVVGAICIKLFQDVAVPAATFSLLYYLLLVTLPVSVYAGARMLGLSPPAAGLAALLTYAPSSAGDFDLYGLDYGSFLWRGLGLYTQLFAMHLLALAIGMGARAIERGDRRSRVWAGVLLALTGASHIVFGYAAFLSVGLLALIGPAGGIKLRLARLAAIAGPAVLLLAWFVVPLALVKEIANHSRWEFAEKWSSYGAEIILRELLSGRLLDAGRLPALGLLTSTGAVVAAFYWRDVLPRRLLALSALWLALFFGRPTWGGLLMLLGIPADLPLHRFQGVFELCVMLLCAYGLERALRLAWGRRRWMGVAAGAAVGLAIVLIGVNREGYLRQDGLWGDENLAAYELERSDLDRAFSDVQAILAERPGRVFAGLATTWGRDFRIYSVPIYAFLNRRHFDTPSFLYHAMSKTADIMVEQDENNRAHDLVFGIRAVVAPAGRAMPGYLRLRSAHGRFAVYEASPEGYFGVVDIVGYYDGPEGEVYEPSSKWLKSGLPAWGQVLSLDSGARVGTRIGRLDPMPAPAGPPVRGEIIEETKSGENYRARISVDQPAYAFVKITWNPDLVATVDGQPAPLFHVTPGFGAIQLSAGTHEVAVSYRPGLLKPFLLLAGIAGFVLSQRFFDRELARKYSEGRQGVPRRSGRARPPR
jgi:hypothetical protein